ncbi:hypothetical protein Hte_012532 [Hypoxylon texense]
MSPATCRASDCWSRAHPTNTLSANRDTAVARKATTPRSADWLGDQLVKVELQDDKDPDSEAVEDDDDVDLDEEDYNLELDDCIVDEDENSGSVSQL